MRNLSREEIFNASQFMIIKCVKALTDLSESFEEFNSIAAKTSIDFLNKDMEILSRLIQVMENMENENTENEEIEDGELEVALEMSSSSSEDLETSDSSSFSSRSIEDKLNEIE